MKKFLLMILTMLLLSLTTFTGCDTGGGDPNEGPGGSGGGSDIGIGGGTHTHTYGTTWVFNGTQHYKQCSCGEKIDVENHVGSPCSVCGYTGSGGGGTTETVATPGTPTITPGYRGLVVTWNTVAYATEYEVYCGTTNAPTTLNMTVTGTSATITGLTGGTTYYVRLKAKNATTTSDYGSSSSGVPESIRTAGLYRGVQKIGNQNITTSLSYITTNAVSGDDFYIILGADETVSPKTLGYSGKTVGITLIGLDSERKVSISENGVTFTVNAGVTLTLDENVTLVAQRTATGDNYGALVRIENGSLIMNEGAKITGNRVLTGIPKYGAGGVFINAGTFTMYGGEISGNVAGGSAGSLAASMSGVGGGGVYVNAGTFIMHGGVISGNYASEGINAQIEKITGSCGGISVSANGTFKKLPIDGGTTSGIIYGSDAVAGFANNGVIYYASSPAKGRGTTAGETDYIDTTTGLGLQ